MREQLSLILIGLLTLNLLLGGTLQGESTEVLPPEIEWARTYGGAANDAGNAVQQTTDGGYILVGETTSFGAGASDVWLLKTDARGIVEWTQVFGGTSYDWARVVQQTLDGGYFLVGSFVGNPWAGKVTSTGALQWNRTFAEVRVLLPSGQYIHNGGYILAGQKGAHFWLGKLDLHGNLEWNQTILREGRGESNDVIPTTDGGYLVVGAQWPPVEHVSADARAVKTDARGRVEWDVTYGGVLHNEWEAVQQTPDHGYILAGASSSYPGTEGDTNFWLVKLNASGGLQWQQTFGNTTTWEVGRSVDLTADGGYILAGHIRSERSQGVTRAAGLIKTGVEGDKEWELILNETGREYANAVHQTHDGGYIVVGATYTTVNRSDVWLLKLGPDRSQADHLVHQIKIVWWVIPGGLLLMLLIRWVRKKPHSP